MLYFIFSGNRQQWSASYNSIEQKNIVKNSFHAFDYAADFHAAAATPFFFFFFALLAYADAAMLRR